VLEFWFGRERDAGAMLAFGRVRWFVADRALDTEIAARFGAAVAGAQRGALDDWAEQPHGRLALLLLLDRFARNLHRDSAAAYAGDARAQRLALDGLRRGHDVALGAVERVFCYMPFEHAERASLQHCALALFEALRDEAPPPLRADFASFADYARRHRTVVLRFGRFPHCNAALGRASTPAEIAFLGSAAAPF
jgi:uncharacterized protein (DUF924 family)